MATTTNFGWETPDDTDLVKDGAAAIRTLGGAIDTSLVDLKGGTTGQVLSKASNTDMDFTWVAQDDSNAIQNTIVDAKGDLISATAADTPARLAVGTNGQVLTADSTASTGLKWATPSAGGFFKNPVLNSNFSVWQRGTSFAAPATNYTADRWAGYLTTGRTLSRQSTNDTTNLPFIQYCVRVARDSGNTSTTAMQLIQSLETVNSIPFAGKTVAFSFYARAGANFSSASSLLGVWLNSGTGTDQSQVTGLTGAANVVNTTQAITTTWTRYTFTGTVPSNSTQLAIQFSYTPVGTAGAADYFEITGVQIEVGSSATDYYPNGNTYQAELAACQRYYFRYASSQYLGAGHMQSTTAADVYIKTPVTMRSAPTYAAASGTSYFQVASSAATTAYSTIGNFYGAGTDGVLGRVTVSGFTAGQGCVLVLNNASAWVEGSAEL